MAKRKQPIGQSIGGVLFGFEQQVWRNQPPPHELVHHARPDDPLPAGDGGFMTLEMPNPGATWPVPEAANGAPVPSLRDLVERATAAVRVVQPMAAVDVGALVGRSLPAVGVWIEAAGLAIDGPPFVRYHAWGGETADLEIGFPIAGDVAALAGLQALHAGGAAGRSSLPGGACAVAVHVGPYPDLGATWGRLASWVRASGLGPTGPGWESYVDNPDLVEHAVIRTDLIQPVAPPSQPVASPIQPVAPPT